MAAPTGKRALEAVEDSIAKKIKLPDEDSKLSSFLNWCKDGHLELSEKVRVGRDGSCAQYGMVATEDIDEGEVIFFIPRTLILTPETSAVADLIEEEADNLQSNSGWVPLLVTLLHEYTSPTSQWRSYLDLVPDFAELDLPMFWPRETLDTELEATGVKNAVVKDLENIELEFNNVVSPFLKNYPLHFPPECNDLELYKKMVAFVLAYSFTEPPEEPDDDSEEPPKQPPMMVPMADILNHVSENNARLDFDEAELKMVATKPIKKGEEVYNTYGELSNLHLLHMYGFTEQYPNNSYDVVEISHKGIEKCLRAQLDGDKEKTELFDAKWLYLIKVDVIDTDNGACVVGADGILTESDMIKTLKVLHMDRETFMDHAENAEDGWESEEEEEEAKSLLYEDFRKLPPEWLETLAVIAKDWLSNYPNSLAVEEANLAPDTWSKLSRRQQFCVNLRQGQMQLLHTLCQHCYGVGWRHE